MFTGLVADLGRVVAASHSPEGVRLEVQTALAGELAEGDSIAVNGVCLTATAIDGERFSTDVMNETLTRSSLAGVEVGTAVNLELPLRAADRLGGHIMQGHVDGTGTIVASSEDGFARRVQIEASDDVLRYLVEKGSIAVDGVSLTVAGIDDRSFTVSLIPETLQRTNLSGADGGTTVNLEVDVLAKYVERLIRR
jgi:riboflavin synthase